MCYKQQERKFACKYRIRELYKRFHKSNWQLSVEATSALKGLAKCAFSCFKPFSSGPPTGLVSEAPKALKVHVALWEGGARKKRCHVLLDLTSQPEMWENTPHWTSPPPLLMCTHF